MDIYADNAATTRMSKTAINAMLPYLDQIYGNPSSMHAKGRQASKALLAARKTIAEVLNCKANEITFTSGGSESDNQAILSAAAIGNKKNKRHIISSSIEHHAVLNTLEKLRKENFEVTLLNAHANGIIRPEELAASIRPDTALVTIMYANNEIGSIQPISKLGEICREKGVIFHTDAVQAAGHININTEKENIDMLSLSAHKFHGPKGTGALYTREGIPLIKLVEGGAQEHGKRAGTENIPAILGMAAALKEASDNIDYNNSKLLSMRDRLIDGLLRIPGTVLNGDQKLRLSGNVNVCFKGIDGKSLLLLLDEKGICASSGSACTSGSSAPSHVLLAIGRSHNMAHGSLRLSLSEENTSEEIEYMINAINDSVSYLRSMPSAIFNLQNI